MQLAIRITLSTVSPDPTYSGGPFVGGVMKMGTANPAIFAWPIGRLVECGSFGERVDIVTGGNYSQLLDFSLSVSNHDKWYADFETAGASLIGALVEIGEAISDDDLDPKWAGTVADANFQGMNVELRVENILASRHKIIPSRILTAQEFGDIATDAEGSAIPSIYGPVLGFTPTPLRKQSDISAAYRVSSLGAIDATMDTSPCLSATALGGNTVWLTRSGDLYGPANEIGVSNFEELFGEIPWAQRVDDGDGIYVRVESGTGSGQSRKISSRTYSLPQSSVKLYFQRLSFSITTPWETIPDSTSSFSFFSLDVAETLVVGDEAEIDRVYVDENGIEFQLASSKSVMATDIVVANVSAEFMSGDDYNAFEYVAPLENYDSPKLTDREAEIVPANWREISGARYNNLDVTARTVDAFCRTKIYANEYPENAADLDSIDLFFSFQSVDNGISNTRVGVVGRLIDGTDEVIANGTSGILTSLAYDFNNFPPDIANGGAYGNYNAFNVSIKLPRPLSAYESIRSALFIAGGYTTQEEYAQVSYSTANDYISGSNKIQVLHDDVYALIPGLKIRPYRSNTDSFRSDRMCLTGGSRPLYIGDHRDWRTISSVSVISSYIDEITLDSAFDIPDGYYDLMVLGSDYANGFSVQREVEAGYGFIYGTIAPDSDFRVDFSSGRTYSTAWPALPSGKAIGDPITLARDAVLDLYYRDLGLGASAVDFASFQALPSDLITSALVERVDSAERVASLCGQFNWVVGHDSLGRETATAWLSRVGSTEYDYSIDTSDVIEGTLTGIAVSDIIDLVNNPNMKWDWTQADGFRQESNVVDVTMDPLLLNSSNYLRYITGFGDFSTALDVYQSLHKSFQINNRQNSSSFEFPDVGNDASGVLWPSIGMSRFDWIASRKPIFQLSVPDTSASAFPPVGKRVRLKHKRYAPNWVHGTIVETSIDPMTAETAITIMGDPTQLASGDNELYIDTIDPSGTIEQYIDQTDGTSEQYTDNIAGA